MDDDVPEIPRRKFNQADYKLRETRRLEDRISRKLCDLYAVNYYETRKQYGTGDVLTLAGFAQSRDARPLTLLTPEPDQPIKLFTNFEQSNLYVAYQEAADLLPRRDRLGLTGVFKWNGWPYMVIGLIAHDYYLDAYGSQCYDECSCRNHKPDDSFFNSCSTSGPQMLFPYRASCDYMFRIVPLERGYRDVH